MTFPITNILVIIAYYTHLYPGFQKSPTKVNSHSYLRIFGSYKIGRRGGISIYLYTYLYTYRYVYGSQIKNSTAHFSGSIEPNCTKISQNREVLSIKRIFYFGMDWTSKTPIFDHMKKHTFCYISVLAASFDFGALRGI